jgi:1-acyl-sn-glycerol-3-phosphate acyltransferase
LLRPASLDRDACCVKVWLSRLFLKLTGWKVVGTPPPACCIVIGAPHTSNWDFAYLVAMGTASGLQIGWLGKHSLFRWPFGWFAERLGGVPVRRDRRENLVQQVAKAFSETDALALCVPPEGTRKRTDYWKSGFYHIAAAADVPIAASFLDYRNKVGGFGPLLAPAGDITADMDVLRAFYADKPGKYPECFGEVRLREEDE